MRCAFTLVTFNSFPGLPLFASGIGQRSKPGRRSRLDRQMQALGRIPAYDIGCFQEVFSRRAVVAYIRFHRSRDMVPLHNGQSSIPRTYFCWTLACFSIALLLFNEWFTAASRPSLLLARGLFASLFAGLGWYLLRTFEESAIAAFSCLSHNRSGLMTFYNARRFHWLDTRVISLGGCASDPMNFLQPRQGHVHLFCERETGHRFYVINTHLNALGSNSARHDQFDMLHSAISGHDHPTFLCGDLNMAYGSAANCGLVTWDPVNNPLCRSCLRVTPPCQIDHIIALERNGRKVALSPEACLTATRTFDMDLTSDHYLLMGSCSLKIIRRPE